MAHTARGPAGRRHRPRPRHPVAASVLATLAVVLGVLVSPLTPLPAPPAQAAPTDTPMVQEEQQITGTGTHDVTVPADATAISVTLSGAAADGGGKGTTVIATANVTATGDIRPGQILTITVDDSGTGIRPVESPVPGAWALAPAGNPFGLPVPATIDTSVFPDATSRPNDNAGPGHATISFSVPAAGIAGPPATADFGAVPVGTTSTRNIAITNSGKGVLKLDSIGAGGAFTVDPTNTSCPSGPAAQATPLAPGASCSIALVYTPTARGAAHATLSLTGNVPDSPRTVALTGSGVVAPGAPATLTAAAGPTGVNLSWMPPADNGGSDITGYQVLRAAKGAPAQKIADLNAGTQVYQDTNAPQGTASSYQVRAVNAAGPGTPSQVANAAPVTTFSVAAAALPAAVVGIPWSNQLTASGGTTPYHWSSQGELPPGMTLETDTGVLSGTPTAAGEFSFTVTATDSSAQEQQARAPLVLTVAHEPVPASTPPAGPPSPALTQRHAGSTGSGSGPAVWLWAALGVVGLAGAVLAVRRLRRRA